VTLRPYQQASIDAAREQCALGRRPVLVLPTGSGKTRLATHGILQPTVARGHRVLWLAHRIELIQQAADDIRLAGITPGILKAGVKPDPAAAVQVASVQTLVRRQPPPAHVVIVDEAHHTRSKTYGRVLEHYPEAFVIGLTATPQRLDGRGLGAVFGAIVEVVTTEQLIADGYLCGFRYYAPSAPDLSGVRTRAGEFDRGGAASAMVHLTGDLVEHYRRHLDGKRALVFGVRVDHSKAITDQFLSAGIPAEHLDGTTPAAERSAALDRFRCGETLVLSNVDLFDEGFDVPDCQGVIVARPTKSLTKHRQMIGRCMRPKQDGSQAVILDHAGNIDRHGLHTDPVEWSLDGRKRPQEVAPGYRTCKECFAVAPRSAQSCPLCGAVFHVEPNPPPKHQVGDLEEASGRRLVRRLKESIFETMLTKARVLGHKPGWAKHQFRVKTGHWPMGDVKALVAASAAQCSHVRIVGGVCNHCGREVTHATSPGACRSQTIP